MNIVEHFIPLIIEKIPALRYSRFIKERMIRKQMILGTKTRIYQEFDVQQLQAIYLETLKELSNGKSYAQTALILGVKEVTIQNRINNELKDLVVVG